MSLLDFNDDILNEICTHIPLIPLASLSLTCRRMHTLASPHYDRQRMRVKQFIARWRMISYQTYIPRKRIQFVGHYNEHMPSTVQMCMHVPRLPKDPKQLEHISQLHYSEVVKYIDNLSSSEIRLSDVIEFCYCTTHVMNDVVEDKQSQLPRARRHRLSYDITRHGHALSGLGISVPGCDDDSNDNHNTDDNNNKIHPDDCLRLYANGGLIMIKKISNCRYVNGIYWFFDESFQLPITTLVYTGIHVEYNGKMQSGSQVVIHSKYLMFRPREYDSMRVINEWIPYDDGSYSQTGKLNRLMIADGLASPCGGVRSPR